MSAPIFDDEYTGLRWRYGCTNRPAGYANIPDGWIIKSNRPHKDFLHGTIDYPRELTDAEIAGYELTAISLCNLCHRREAGGANFGDVCDACAERVA